MARVLAFKRQIQGVKAADARAQRAKLEKLSRQLWEFSEQVRLATINPAGPGMIVAGVMSGTSADGINVALVRVNTSSPRPDGDARPPVLLAHAEYPYPKTVRRAVLAAMNSTKASVADLARLNLLACRTLR